MMKVRFGEQSLHGCVVMLKDINESNRLGKQFTKEKLALLKSSAPVDQKRDLLTSDKLSVHIISKHFWQ